MDESSPRLGRTLIGGLALCVLIGSVWYIVYLRAENTRLERSRGPGAPAAPAPPIRPADVGDGRALSSEQRDRLLNGLRSTLGSERPVWFNTPAGDGEATAFRMNLQTLFEEAGWDVRGAVQVPFPIKPGLYLFSADEEPPEYVHTVVDALEAAGLKVSLGRGYRQFYEERKRENPNWNGFELKPDQTYVVVIGPKPPA